MFSPNAIWKGNRTAQLRWLRQEVARASDRVLAEMDSSVMGELIVRTLKYSFPQRLNLMDAYMAENPPFINTQTLWQLRVEPDQRHKVRDYLLGKNLELPVDGEDEQQVVNSNWQPVNRREFLSKCHPDARGVGVRACITGDGGFGKSVALKQLQYLQQLPVTEPDEQRRANLVVRMALNQLPTRADRLLEKKWKEKTGSTAISYRPVLVEAVRDVLATRVKQVELPMPKRRVIRSLLRNAIHRGSLTLIVDGLDEVATEDGKPRIAALKQFLLENPAISVFIGCRKYALEDYWSLFTDGTPLGSTWQFATPAPFQAEQCKTFVGEDRYQLLQSLGANEMFVPRTLDIVRKLDADTVASIRSAADVYWHSIDETFREDFEKHRKAGKIELGRDDIIDLFGALAFTCLTWKESGPILQVARNEFGKFETDFLKIGNGGFEEWDDAKKQRLPEFLLQLAEINSQFIQFAFLGSRDIKQLNWRNPTVRDFLAALWAARRGGDEERQRTCQRTPIRTSATERNLAYYEYWKFLTEMPALAYCDADTTTSFEDDAIESYVDVITPLFEVVAGRRPAEMIFRCWPRLLYLAGWCSAQPDESAVEVATTRLQAEVWRIVQTGNQPTGKNRAEQLVMDWLAEYPQIVFDETHHGHSTATNFEATFRHVPSNVNDSLSFWHGAEEKEDTIPARFCLSAEQITNELIYLYDANHANLNDDEGDRYRRNSPYPRGPAIYVSWFDAWCICRWFHGKLPTSAEWEYACRASPGAGHRSAWHFGGSERKSQLVEYAWYRENSADVEDLFVGKQPEGRHAHTVGRKRANDFGLCDMHGNVWEWCSSVYPGESGQNASRVLRGGSFDNNSLNSRCSIRLRVEPALADHSDGVRVARA